MTGPRSVRVGRSSFERTLTFCSVFAVWLRAPGSWPTVLWMFVSSAANCLKTAFEAVTSVRRSLSFLPSSVTSAA
jgi:hypothetical protein